MNEEPRLTKRQRKELRRQERREEQERTVQSKKTKKLTVWVIVVVVLGGGVWALIAAGGTDTVNARDIDPAQGPEGAPVVIEAFEDFQCPACGAAQPAIKELLAMYPNDIRYVYNDYPLRTIHSNAQAAAEAGMCADEQGMFWTYHDRLYDEQGTWGQLSDPTSTFVLYAEELELDVDAFQTCVESRTFKSNVDFDVSEGTRRRVSSTPSFFVNDELVSGVLSIEEWQNLMAQNGVTEPTTPALEDPADESSMEETVSGHTNASTEE